MGAVKVRVGRMTSGVAIALLRKTRRRGTARVEWMFLFGLAAYHLVLTGNLEAPSG